MDIYILRDGKQIGPFSEETTHQMLKQGAVLINDPAWRPGMAEWIPLHSVLYPAPPVMAPVPQTTAAPVEPATEKQKVFLRYLGIPFSASLSEEEAATLVQNATENPKNATRIAQWNDDRLKLHPHLFAAELEEKRAQRPQYFYELCQAEGAEALEGVTRAHCQVLVGYLDEKFPKWDAGSGTDAAWRYFFPAVAEKFPQFVRGEWKEKLKYPEPPKAAPEAAKRTPAVPVRATSSAKRKTSSPVASALKGLFLGLLIVGVGAGGYYAYKNPKAVDEAKALWADLQAKYLKKGKTADQKPAAQPAPAQDVPSLFSDSTPAGGTTSAPAMDSAPAAETKPAETVAPMAEASQTDSGMMASAPAPELPESAPASNNSTMSLFDPTPSSEPEPATGGLPPPKTTVTLLQAMDLQSPYGTIKVPAGTQLPIVEQDGMNLKVKFQNQIITVPVSSTDLGAGGMMQ